MANKSVLEQMTENGGLSSGLEQLFTGGRTASFCRPFVVRDGSKGKKSALSPMLHAAATADADLREPLITEEHWKRLEAAEYAVHTQDAEATTAGTSWKSVERKRLGETIVLAREEQKLKDELRERFDFWAFVSDTMKRYRHNRSPGGCMTKWSEIETLWFNMRKNKGGSGNGLFGVDLIFFNDFEPFMDKTKDRYTETYILDNDFDLSSIRQKSCAIETGMDRQQALQSLLRAPVVADDILAGDILRGDMNPKNASAMFREQGTSRQDAEIRAELHTSADRKAYGENGQKVGEGNLTDADDTEVGAPFPEEFQSAAAHDDKGKTKVRVGVMLGCCLDKLHVHGDQKRKPPTSKRIKGALIPVVVASYNASAVNVRTLDNTIAELHWRDIEGEVKNTRDFVDKDCAEHIISIGCEVCLRPEQDGSSLTLDKIRKANELIYIVRGCGQGWIFCTKKNSRRPRLLACERKDIMRRDRMNTTPEPWAPHTAYPFVLHRKNKNNPQKGLLATNRVSADLTERGSLWKSVGAGGSTSHMGEAPTTCGMPTTGGARPTATTVPSTGGGYPTYNKFSSSGGGAPPHEGGPGGAARQSGGGGSSAPGNDRPGATNSNSSPGGNGNGPNNTRSESEKNFESLYKYCAWVDRNNEVFFCLDVTKENGLGAILLGSDNKLRTRYDVLIEGGFLIEPHEQKAKDSAGFDVVRGSYVTYKKNDLGDTAIVLSIAEDWLLIQNKILTNANGATVLWSKTCITLKNRGKNLLADLEGKKYQRRTDDKVPPKRSNNGGGNGNGEDMPGTSNDAAGNRRRSNEDKGEEGSATKKQKEKQESQHENRTQSMMLAMKHLGDERAIDSAQREAMKEQLSREQREDREAMMAQTERHHGQFMGLLEQLVALEKAKQDKA